jgi:hypothetical protein
MSDHLSDDERGLWDAQDVARFFKPELGLSSGGSRSVALHQDRRAPALSARRDPFFRLRQGPAKGTSAPVFVENATLMASLICNTNEHMERDATLIVRLPAALKEALRRAAEADHGRSLSGLAVRALSEWIEANGQKSAAPRRRSKRRG